MLLIFMFVGFNLMSDDQPTSKKDLVITRTFNAPLPDVWKAWTDADEVKKWWGPTGFTCSYAKLDVREGRTSLVCMKAPPAMGGKDMYSTWAYTKVVKHELLDYIHNLSDANGKKMLPKDLGMPADFPVDQRHTVAFKEVSPGKTEVTIIEFGWTPGHMMEFSKIGMNQCLDKMAATFMK
jgi:uncharacterized protein YndB with AHSA1/START domain